MKRWTLCLLMIPLALPTLGWTLYPLPKETCCMQLYGVGKKLDEVPSCNGIAPLKKECEVIIENWKKVSKNWFNNLNKYGDPLGQTKIMPSPPPISPSTSPLPQ